jgi:hypothetical protein
MILLNALDQPKLDERDENVAISKSENSVGQDVHTEILLQEWQILLRAGAYR